MRWRPRLGLYCRRFPAHFRKLSFSAFWSAANTLHIAAEPVNGKEKLNFYDTGSPSMKAASKPDGLSIPQLIKSPSALLILIFLISRCICISIHLGPAHHSLVTIFSDFPLRYFANVTLWSRSFPAVSSLWSLQCCNLHCILTCAAAADICAKFTSTSEWYLDEKWNGILAINLSEIQWTHVISFCQLLHTWWCYPA